MSTGWLPILTLLVNLGVLALMRAYSSVNLHPDFAAASIDQPQASHQLAVYAAVTIPSIAAWLFLRPIRARLHRAGGEQGGLAIPAPVAERAAHAPLALAAFSLAGWGLVIALALLRSATSPDIPLGVALHLVIRPILAGLIAAAGTFFAVEYVCRTRLWPALLAGTPIAGNPRLWRVRVAHRFLALWLIISLLPLSAVALTTLARVDSAVLRADPLLERIVTVVLLIAASAVAGGAWLAWLVARSVGRPLETLEHAMRRFRDGQFEVRVPVSATDETGALSEGFNLLAERLSESHAALEARGRELAAALDRVVFLERVKHGLDRFVPDTVRRAIEDNPEAPGLEKMPKDVTVLFLDIEGYSRLSEQLPRRELDSLVERYFSLYLAPIRAEGGDINETAGDGLMIVFQSGAPEAHAAAAARAALAIREATRLANREGRLPIAVNLGISSGECEVGTTRFHGAAGERWTFTATGPVTNLAARLGAHATGGQILLSPETVRRVRDRFPLRNLGLATLKNLAQAVEVWQLE